MDNVAEFMAITQAEDSTAQYFLSLSDDNLENALSLFFNQEVTGALMDTNPPAPTSPAEPAVVEERRPPPPTTASSHVTQLEDGIHDLASIPDQFSSPRTDPNPFSQDPILAGMFQRPSFVDVSGDLRKICHRALQLDRWVLLALVDTATFHGFDLTRDVWNNEIIAPVITNSVVVAELDYSKPQHLGQISQLQVERQAKPTVLLLDPLTMHCEHQIPLVYDNSGGIEPTTFLDFLLVFIGGNGSPEQHRNDEMPLDGVHDGVPLTSPVAGESTQGSQQMSPISPLDGPMPDEGSPSPVSEENVRMLWVCTIDKWIAAEDDASAYVLNCRLPRREVALRLLPNTPSDALAKYLSYLTMVDEGKPHPPQVALLNGFPRKAVSPMGEGIIISQWGLRQRDAIIVHVL